MHFSETVQGEEAILSICTSRDAIMGAWKVGWKLDRGIEKMDRGLASWGKLLDTLAECTCAVALDSGGPKKSVLPWKEECCFHLGKYPTAFYYY